MNAKDLAGTDDLAEYTPLHRENYLLENSHLIETLPQGASVLQIGSMDGIRAIGLLQARPDLSFTGLDIEAPLTELAAANTIAAGVQAIFVTGDILSPQALPHFDFAVCLNNTLAYISTPIAAISNMRSLADEVIVSAFTEAYNVTEAKSYYNKLGLSVERVEDDAFVTSDGWRIHRFTSTQVGAWEGTQMRTPLGWLVKLAGLAST